MFYLLHIYNNNLTHLLKKINILTIIHNLKARYNDKYI